MEILEKLLLNSENFSRLLLRRAKTNDSTSLVSDKLPGLLIHGVTLRHVKVHDIRDIMQSRQLTRVSLLHIEHDQDVELANQEEVNDRLNLLLCHVRGQHKGLHMESVQEELDPICLNDRARLHH